jgi:uncharacterized protein
MTMKYKRFKNKIIVRIDKGEEIVSSLKQLCITQKITLGTIQGIGATNNITLGYLDTTTKQYCSIEYTGDHEIAPLIGNITTMNDEVYLHLHVNICNTEQKSFCGHLSKAIVSVTFEAVIDVIDGKVNRILDKDTGINLLDL